MWETAARLLLLSAAAVAAAAAAIATEGDAIPQLTSVEASSTPPATPPHILFIVVDDHGYSDCGYTGRSFIRTPTIDSFASEGVVLENMYVQKVCSPTRTAIMTSRYPHRMGMQVPFCGGMPQGLNLNETLMPQYLAKVGYSAHAVGKWHLGFTSWQHCPTFRGFESFYGYYNCAEDYFTHSVPGRNATYGLDFHDDPTPNCGPNCSRPAWEAAFAPRCYDQDQHESQECYPSGGTWDGFGTSIDDPDGTRMCFSCNDIEHYSTHLFASRATTVIHEHATKNRNVSTPQPLFLYFPLQDTHGPVEVPSLYKDAAAPEIVDNLRREIAGKLAAVDEAINNVTEALKAEDMLDNTLIIYTTDNGGPIVPTTGAPDDAVGASNYPLRGGKHNPYEGGVKATSWIWDGRGQLHSQPTPAALRPRIPLVHETFFSEKAQSMQAQWSSADKPPPSKIQRSYSGLAHAVDWLPTLCAIAGCSHLLPDRPPSGEPNPKYGLLIDGIDLSSAIAQNSSSPRTQVVLDIEDPGNSTAGSGTVRIGDWKLLIGIPNAGRPGDWSNHQPWLNVTGSEPNVPNGVYQLYNVAEDPEERHDRVNDTLLNATLSALKEFYEAERSVSVYPFNLGPAGHPNAQGVWEPWLPSPM